MNRERLIASVVTALMALCILLVLFLVKIGVDTTPREWPPRHGTVAMADDEQLFEVLEPERPDPVKGSEASPAHNEEVAQNQSEPAPEAGMDLKNSGKAAEAPAPATTKQPSPVKQQVKETPPAKQGPSKEELAQQEQKRQINNSTANAFANAKGKNNTSSTGKEPGNSGAPNGKNTSGSGQGTGQVGGGWKAPAYSNIPSATTGKIVVRCTVGPDGKVDPASITFENGLPPAATDAALRAKVKAEVLARRYTRSASDPAPERATAKVTYTFK